MNDELQKQLLTWAQDAANIASTEVPELARQYIQREMASSSLGCLFAFILLIGALVGAKKSADNHMDEGIVISLIIAACSFTGVIINTVVLVKCIVAPKLVLLDLLS